MKIPLAHGLRHRLRIAIANRRPHTVYYVGDKRGRWSFHWDGLYITRGIRERCGWPARVIEEPWGLRKQIIHFGNRYTYFDGPYQELHAANNVFLTWFHGSPADPDPDIQRLLALMLEASGLLDGIVVTCGISRKILSDLGIAADKLITIPLGVDLMRFLPPSPEERRSIRGDLGIPGDAVCIGSFQKDGVGWGDDGEPKLVKGPDIFLEAIAALKHRHRNIFVLLTGPARGYVKRGLEQLGVPYSHRFLSDYHAIVPYYQALDLYLIASRTEGGPKALLEAWATGVPLVTTRVGMAPEMIVDGVNGFIVDLEDADAMAVRASELIQDVALREQFTQEGLQAAPKYDWGVIAEQYYEKLYKPLLEG
jgi:glycosyltransferase involved in cell wall biosynthesis